MRALVVTNVAIEAALTEGGFICDRTDLGEDALQLCELYDYDVIVLDLTPSELSGYEVLRRLRASHVETPVIVVSDLIDIDRKLKSFELGADDFLGRPFDHRELLARAFAVVRRSRSYATPDVHFDKLSVNFDERTLRVDDVLVRLTNREFAVLELLILRKGMTLTKEMFLNHLYGGIDEPDLKIIDVFICKLRKKLARATGGDHYIETVSRRGWRLVKPLESLAA